VILHVDGAAAPQAAVGLGGAERRVLPPRRIRLDDVEVCREQQRRRLAGAAVAHDQVGATGRGLVDHRIEADLAQLGGEVVRGLTLRPGRVRRVHAEERGQHLLRVTRERRRFGHDGTI
jgi:hypothetical protein